VSLIVESNDTNVAIRVVNNGKGIPEQEQKQIFDSFYQLSEKRYPGSSGLGLALVKSYVEMHRGSIMVKSEENKETEFVINLQRGRNHLHDNEILTANTAGYSLEKEVVSSNWIVGRPAFHHKGTKGAKVLVVEDNPELQNYLVELLSEYYEIVVVDNGKQGLEKVIEWQPNLVVSDVMMPIMDGYELCQRIKSNDLTSHIPVILLTAKVNIDDKLFGAQKGADAYLTKPFDPQYLLENIKQLISSRKELANKYMRRVTLEPTNQEITKEDEKMLNTAMSVIEKNIGNVELNLDFLANKLAMSSTTLYRKFKAVSGQTPGEFIKKVRLKRAAQLLKDSDKTVSEIVEMVGYQDIKRFRESFKTEFDLSPSDYRKNHQPG
jgi:CheY-like chemotaxis protein